jgi:hypothetical protein
MMKLHDNAAVADVLPSNVIAFPLARRRCAAALPSSHRSKQPAATAGSDLNARLLLLLGICVTSATRARLAVHILHG